MKSIGYLAILIIIIASAGPLFAGSVYYWTDENGVRHFSNTGVPDGVDEANVRPEEIAPEQPADTGDQSEPDADKDSPPASPEEGEAGDGEKEVDERLEARAEKERERLEAEIEKIQNLAIGRSFTQGMKDNRIKAIEEQLALLAADPKRYFRMKRQGAFQSSTDSSTENESATPTNPAADQLTPGPGTSSTGSAAGDAEASPEEASQDDTNDDAGTSRRARSSGSASDALSRDNTGPPASSRPGGLTPNQNISSGSGQSRDDSATQDEGASDDGASRETRSRGSLTESLSQGYFGYPLYNRSQSGTPDQNYTAGSRGGGEEAIQEAPQPRGTISRGSESDTLLNGGPLYPTSPQTTSDPPGRSIATGSRGADQGFFPN
jgi:hypothetical protein